MAEKFSQRELTWNSRDRERAPFTANVAGKYRLDMLFSRLPAVKKKGPHVVRTVKVNSDRAKPATDCSKKSSLVRSGISLFACGNLGRGGGDGTHDLIGATPT
jgi:hypothetical protein